MTVRRQHRLKRTDDPLLPFSVKRLGTLLRERRISQNALAERVGVSQQSISAMLKPGVDTRRCRRSTLQRLARVLGVPQGLLQQTPIVLPEGPAVPDGYEYRYSDRTRWAASRLLTRVQEACLRDLERERGETIPLVELRGPTEADAGPLAHVPENIRRRLAGLLVAPPEVTYVVSCFAEFLQIREWRTRFLLWSKQIVEARGYSEPAAQDAWTDHARPSVDEAHEEAVLALCRVMEHILTPWFDGQARLNYRAVGDWALFHRRGPLRFAEDVAPQVTDALRPLISSPSAREGPAEPPDAAPKPAGVNTDDSQRTADGGP